MLVTFTCKAHADTVMFGNVAVALLRMMGHSGTVPGALLADDVRAALERLEAGVEAAGDTTAESQDTQDDDGEPAVSLRHRALPLIGLLKAAADANVNVMWH